MKYMNNLYNFLFGLLFLFSGIGLSAQEFLTLDDAIMIEMVNQELKHEIQAYRDFCVFRAAEANRLGNEAMELGRSDWLEERRKQLHSRMRRRRTRKGSGKGNSPFSLF